MDRSGLEWLRAAMDGREPAPPAADALGLRIVAVEEGAVAFALDPAEAHLNGIGTVHGGVLAALADSAASCAVLSTLPPGVICPTVELSVHFLRPVTTTTGRLRAAGRQLSAGRRTAFAEARVTDPDGRLVAHATVTCLLTTLAEER